MRCEVSVCKGRWLTADLCEDEEKDWKINWSGFEEVFDVARLRLQLIESDE